jgi:hypothetical protein
MIPALAFIGVAAISLFPVRCMSAQAQGEGTPPVTIDDVEFQLRSAALGKPNDSYVTARVTLAATNKSNDPVGLFVFWSETSVATETAVTISGGGIHAGGVGVCQSTRDLCVKGADGYVTSLPPKVTDSMILELSMTPSQDQKKALAKSASIDVAVTIYLRRSDGTGGFVPLSFTDVPLRSNMWR